MIAIIDYGMGNLRSVQKALEHVGAKAVITQNPSDLARAKSVVLPGVGAMKPAMDKLESMGFIPAIKTSISSGKPFLGICLGAQLLFEESDEGGSVKGLNILKGRVERFKKLKVPHMGWNQLKVKDTSDKLFKSLTTAPCVYFCHSYFVQPQDVNVIATLTDYGVNFASAVHSQNVHGVQFHPEKSQAVGLTILKNFTELL